MPIAVRCPNCDEHYNLADNLAGKVVACRVCKGKITVPTRAEPARSDARRRDDREDRPRQREDDRPRRRERDEDDEDRRTPQGMNGAVLAIVGGGLLLFLIGGGVLLWKLTGPATPAEANVVQNLPPVRDKDKEPPPKNDQTIPPRDGPPRDSKGLPQDNTVPPKDRTPPKDGTRPVEPVPKPPELPKEFGRADYPGSGARPIPGLLPAQLVGRLLPRQMVPKVNVPEPTTAAKPFTPLVTTSDTARLLTLPHKGGDLVRGTCWSKDGQALYLAEKSGIVHCYAGALTKEVASLNLGTKVGGIGLSAVGVVVTVPDRQELWVLDADTLTVKDRWVVAGRVPPTDFATATGVSVAWVPAGLDQPDVLVRIDLKTGETREYPARAYDPRTQASFTTPCLTPDGKILFTKNLAGIQGYVIQGDALILAETSEPLGSNTMSVCLSPDGRRVAMPAGGGNGGNGYLTYFYETTSLQRPALVIRTGAHPRTVGFDSAADLIYAMNGAYNLLVFDSAGTIRGAHRFWATDVTDTITASPTGWRVFLAAHSNTGVVELAK